jgi:hypothetical protein
MLQQVVPPESKNKAITTPRFHPYHPNPNYNDQLKLSTLPYFTHKARINYPRPQLAAQRELNLNAYAIQKLLHTKSNRSAKYGDNQITSLMLHKLANMLGYRAQGIRKLKLDFTRSYNESLLDTYTAKACKTLFASLAKLKELSDLSLILQISEEQREACLFYLAQALKDLRLATFQLNLESFCFPYSYCNSFTFLVTSLNQHPDLRSLTLALTEMVMDKGVEVLINANYLIDRLVNFNLSLESLDNIQLPSILKLLTRLATAKQLANLTLSITSLRLSKLLKTTSPKPEEADFNRLLTALNQLPSLSELAITELSNCYSLPPLQPLTNPRLTKLSLSVNPGSKLQDQDLSQLSSMLSQSPQLTSLHLSFHECPELTKAGVSQFISQLAALSNLSHYSVKFCRCTKITTNQLVYTKDNRQA